MICLLLGCLKPKRRHFSCRKVKKRALGRKKNWFCANICLNVLFLHITKGDFMPLCDMLKKMKNNN